MDLNVEDSPVLARMVQEKRREGGLALFRARLAGMGIDGARDEGLLERLSVEGMVDAERRLSSEESWASIRDRSAVDTKWNLF